ncbi:MAG: bifunctional riboflavin kinase/FAD synthetase [bacterium]
MKILRSIDALGEIDAPVVLAAGVFDGLHLGHQAVLLAARDSAARIGGIPVALTFDPHPAAVLRPQRIPRLLTPLDDKLRLIERLGIEHALVISFDAAFAAMEAEDFVLKLCRAASQLAGICIGEGWLFGHDRRGDARLLQKLGMKNGFFTSATAPVLVDGEVVSSTRIRECLSSGDLAQAARLLGREFALRGTVARGAGLGGKLGFPTANIAATGLQYPSNGVYAIEARFHGHTVRGVANIGVRPTVAEKGPPLLEVHLFDFSGDLYDQDIEVAFLHFLRGEKKFGNLEELRKQIEKDAATARAWLQTRIPTV